MDKVNRLQIAAVLIAMLVVAGCRKSGETASVTDSKDVVNAQNGPLELPSVIVDIEWLKEHIHDERLVIVDARKPEEYAKGHIAGAINMTPYELAKPDPKHAAFDSSHDIDMAPVADIQRIVGNAGIDSEKTVIVYDGDDYRPAARIFWVLEVHGHPSIGVLNKGIQGWQDAGLPISTQPAKKEPAVFIANMQTDRYVIKLDVFKAIGKPDISILDSRSAPEYSGKVSAFDRSGHISGAVNVDFMRNLDQDESGGCSIRYSDKLADIYRSKFENKEKIIAYCNTGTHATVTYLILRSLGYPVAVYDGSWKEWSLDSSMPIEVSHSLDTL